MIVEINQDSIDAYRGELTKQVEENNGAVRVFVHVSASPLKNRSEKGSPPKPLDLLKKIVTRQLGKQTPIILLEDKSSPWVLRRELPQSLTRNVFVVPTKYNDPEPLAGWKVCIDLFKNLGIKRVVVCGNYFLLRNGAYPGGCVCGAVEELCDHFEVRVSHFIGPESRKTFYQYWDSLW